MSEPTTDATAFDTMPANVAAGDEAATPDQPAAAAPSQPVAAADPAAFDLTDQADVAAAAPIASVRRIDLLGNVTMEVAAELGRTRMTVRDLLSLTPGTVVELDRAAGSPVDLLVNGTLVARGEVVVIDEEFGVRISEIVSGNADEELSRAATA